jgi:hypothetical protein
MLKNIAYSQYKHYYINMSMEVTHLICDQSK